MKIQDIEEFIDSYKERFEGLKESERAKRLLEMRKVFAMEIDKRLSRFRGSKELVKEAFDSRRYLKKYEDGFFHYVFHARLRHVVSMPFIYSMIVPALMLHVFLEVYQQVCFRLYGIKRVSSRDYFIFDRPHLGYLNSFEKFNCAYCSYVSGLMAYGVEIAGRTEQYWCPIKHARRRADTHKHYDDFFEYLDGEGYRKDLETVRKNIL